MRAVGIVRQSKGREEALSPAEQRTRISEHCVREGFELVEVREEIDVSGGTPLGKRDGLRGAVEAIEAGGAQVLIVAYFDRLVRSLTVQAEVVGRVEAAGGRVVAVDFGEISDRTAAQWISATTLGMVSEYYRRSVRERAGAAQAEAVAKGVVPWPNIPPGYERQESGALAPGEDAVLVAEAFGMRAKGATIREVRAFLREGGVERSYHGVQAMLCSRIYVGEIHFGGLVNLEAHEPIVDRATFEAVQRVRVSRGRRAKSDRLLARLGVLRCGTCGSRMVVGTVGAGRRYGMYRCPPTGDCPRRLTISAEIAEGFVVETVKEALRDLEGRASSDREARGAEAALEQAQAALDAALRAFGEFGAEAAAVERLRELRAVRDAARERVAHLGRLSAALTVSVADWPILTLDEKRDLIRATVERVEVAPGRGHSRLSATLLV